MAMEITVSRANRSNYSLELKESDTVESVKAKIEEREGIHSSQQRLMMMGARFQNENTLRNYKIKTGQSISLAWIEGGEMQLFIKHKAGTFLLEFHKSQTVAAFKAKIMQKLQIPSHHKKKLKLGNVVLSDEKHVSSYDGIDLSVIDLVDG